MGQLDHFTNRARARRVEQKVDFTGSVEGDAHEGLRRALILEFVTRPVIARAYLARITVAGATEASTALCLVSSAPDDHAIVTRAGEIHARLFPEGGPLDVVFVTPAQEADLRRVAQPFYARPGA